MSVPRARTLLMSAALVLLASPAARAGFLDLDTVTAGPGGSFTGTLDGISVTGVLTGNGPALVNGAITDNSSPQFSYAGIYTPSIPLTDQVNFGTGPGAFGQGFTITFGAPITDPVFHIAGLSRKGLDFSATSGLISLTLLSGNGGADGEGLQVIGNVISDANSSTPQETPASSEPATTGARAAYGSVQLNGTFSSLNFTLVSIDGAGDGGSFTLSTSAVPTPAALPASLALLAPLLLRRQRRWA